MRAPHGRAGFWTLFTVGAVVALVSPAAATGQEAPLTLTDVVRSALDTRPERERSHAAVDMANAAARAARASLFPTLGVRGSVQRFDEPMVVAPLHGFDPMAPPRFDRTLVRGQLDLEYTVFDGGRAGAERAAASHTVAAARATREDVEAAVIVGSARAFLELYVARAVLEAAVAREAALAAELDRARRFHAEGAAAAVDTLRAHAAWVAAEAEHAARVVAVDAATSELSRWAGEDGASLADRAFGSDHGALVATPIVRDLDTLPPTLRAAQLRVDAATARARGAGAARLPDIRVQGGLVEYGSGAGDFSAEWQAGVVVSVPLFTGGALTAARERAEAEHRRTRAELELARLDLDRVVHTQRAAWIAARERLGAATTRVTLLEEVARIERLALTEGVGVQRDLLTAEAELFGARSERARAEADAALARLAMERARGTLTWNWLSSVLGGAP